MQHPAPICTYRYCFRHIFEVETKGEPNHCISRSTGKDASSCVVHLINDGVVVNGYDVSIQFLGSRSVRSYLCKMDDGNFYACKNIV